MEPIEAKRLADEEISEALDKLRRAAYIHFNQDEILALEDLIRRYKRAISKRTSE